MRFKGTIGYVISEETDPGVFQDTITEKTVSGDILRNSQSWVQTEQTNPNFSISNRFSIISDAYLQGNLDHIAFLKWKNVKWKVTSAEMAHPRVIVSVQGVYNG